MDVCGERPGRRHRRVRAFAHSAFRAASSPTRLSRWPPSRTPGWPA